MKLEDRLAQNPPSQAQIKKINGGNNTPISIDASFDKIEKKINKKEVDAIRGKLGNGSAGHTPSKPYSDIFK